MDFIVALVTKLLLLLVGIPIATVVVAFALSIVIAVEILAAIGFILLLVWGILTTSNN